MRLGRRDAPDGVKSPLSGLPWHLAAVMPVTLRSCSVPGVLLIETDAHLTLRSARSARLEGWATDVVLVPTLRDAALVYPEALEGAAPQGEAIRCGDSNCIGKTLVSAGVAVPCSSDMATPAAGAPSSTLRTTLAKACFAASGSSSVSVGSLFMAATPCPWHCAI